MTLLISWHAVLHGHTQSEVAGHPGRDIVTPPLLHCHHLVHAEQRDAERSDRRSMPVRVKKVLINSTAVSLYILALLKDLTLYLSGQKLQRRPQYMSWNRQSGTVEHQWLRQSDVRGS